MIVSELNEKDLRIFTSQYDINYIKATYIIKRHRDIGCNYDINSYMVSLITSEFNCTKTVAQLNPELNLLKHCSNVEEEDVESIIKEFIGLLIFR